MSVRRGVPRVARWLGAAALLGAVGCAAEAPRVSCTSPEQVLAQVGDALLACTDSDQAVRYIELAAGRPMDTGDRDRVRGALAAAFQADPAGVGARVKAAAAEIGATNALTKPSEKLERRGTLAWTIYKGQSVFAGQPGLDEIAAIEKRALAVWSFDDAEKLALTEADIEAWIRYASLCREVQGGGAVRLSVADRVIAYKIVQDRWETVDRAGKLGLVGFGPVWTAVADTWAGATYEEQQAWIKSAPLPPPMTATSLAYVEAILEGDPGLHARTLHAMLGPFLIHGL